MTQQSNTKKDRSSVRILVLRPLDAEKVKDPQGLIDNRLFKGENELYAYMDTETCLWSMRYKFGIVPESLKQKFTNFNKLYRFAEGYFAKRGVQIKEVIDDQTSDFGRLTRTIKNERKIPGVLRVR